MNRVLPARPASVIHLFALTQLLALSAPLVAQTLQITSPADGSVVYSGQKLKVAVGADPSAFQGIAVIGQSPLGSTLLATAAPYQFYVDIPRGVTLGNYTLTAMGIPQSGREPVLASIVIDVERSDAPTRLSSEFSPIPFRYVGATDYLLITGVFADGSQVTLTRSTRISYSSDTPRVATVSDRGMVTALGPGTANIIVTYANSSIGQTSIRVPVTVPRQVEMEATQRSVYVAQTAEFVALVNMDPSVDQSVRWSINPRLGSIDQTGVYTAPSSISSWQAVTVTATSVADPTKSASARLWVFPPVSVAITPSRATLRGAQSQAFIARVANGSSDVTWSLVPAGVGRLQAGRQWDPNNPFLTIAAATYFAPSRISAPRTVTIRATSVYDNSKTATVQVSLVP